MELIGILKEISFVGKLKARYFIIDCSPFPEYNSSLVRFELLYSCWDMLDGFQLGDLVNVHFIVRGIRSEASKNKFSTILQAMHVEKIQVEAEV